MLNLHISSGVVTNHFQPEGFAMWRHAGARPVDHNLHRDIQSLASGADESGTLDVAFGEREGKKGNPLTLFRHFKIGRGQN